MNLGKEDPEAVIKRAEMYQEYMNQMKLPTVRGSVTPFRTWQGFGKSMKQIYKQPLHYLTNVQLKKWDRLRIGAKDEDQPLDTIIHPLKAESTIWLIEEIHRRTISHHYLAELWLGDANYHAFVDSDVPKLGS